MVHLHKEQKQAKLTHAFERPDSGSPWGHGSNREGTGGELLMLWVLVFSFKIQQAVHLYLQKNACTTLCMSIKCF